MQVVDFVLVTQHDLAAQGLRRGKHLGDAAAGPVLRGGRHVKQWSQHLAKDCRLLALALVAAVGRLRAAAEAEAASLRAELGAVRREGGAREAAGAGTMALALPLAVAPARRMDPSRWYERVGEPPPPTELADARAMVGRRLLVRVAVVGGCHDSGWCLAQVEAEHKRPETRIAAVHGGLRVRLNYDVRLLHTR